MVKVRSYIREKSGQGGTGRIVSSGTTSTGSGSVATAAYARRAGEADHADRADYADEAYHTALSDEARHALLADEAKDVTADSPAYDRWLRKDRADRTPYDLGVGGRVTADGGVQFGASFADGLTGHGGLIDGDGAGTLDSLTLRRWLEVPELRYNRVTVLRSVTWATSGAGIIESVVPSDATHGRAWLKLEEGEPGSLLADDICMGIWHDLGQTLADSDDGRGNFRFQGFRTCYFRVTASASDGSWIDYELRPVSGSFPVAMHPVEGMHVAAYGNFTDKERQQSRYETTSYVRFLHGVCDWEFGEANIAAQFGDLSNLTVGGVAMKGYSVYLDNVYMSGVIRKIEISALELSVTLWRGDEEIPAPVEMAPGDEVSLRASVRDGWAGLSAGWSAVWSLESSEGDPAGDFEGERVLTFDDLGNSARALVTVVCTVTDPEGKSRVLRRSVSLVRRESMISDAGVWAEGRTYLDGSTPDAQGRLVTHDVWHNGQRWRCVVANVSASSNAPGVGSSFWVFVAGDDELHVSFAEPEMLASLNDFRYPLTVTARWHGEDVTPLIADSDVVWERYTENREGVERAVLDAQWTAANSGRGRSILLTLPDLDLGSDGIGVTRFTATVTFHPPDGAPPRVTSIAWEGV